MKLYQIVAKGEYKNFPGSSGSYHSKQIFKTTPTQKQIDKFVDKCCNTKSKPDDLYDLLEAGVNTKIITLILY